MDRNKLIELRKRLLALSLAGVMIGATGCSNTDENGVPKRVAISSEYSNIDDYYKYAMQNGEAIKLYDSKKVYLLFDKVTYQVNEYLYQDGVILGLGAELYDLESEEMLAYSDGIATTYNEEYYNYLIENNYQVCLNDVGDYIEGYTNKKDYSLNEIKELEPKIAESLKIINAAKVKTK